MTSLNDRALLREALNEYNNWYFDWENNRKVQFDDPILRGNEISCADTYLAAMNGQYKIDWFNLMNAESGMLLAANMMTNANFNAQSLINGANAKPSWLEADINPETWEGSFGGGGNKSGKFIDNTTDSITIEESRVVDDLVGQGKTVERIPRSDVKTPDFNVNGVRTELKTLENANTTTGVGRIQQGFKQNAETVIIDARGSGLTSQQAREIIYRAAGTYPNRAIPGKVEIWINGQVIFYP